MRAHSCCELLYSAEKTKREVVVAVVGLVPVAVRNTAVLGVVVPIATTDRPIDRRYG